MGSTTETTNRAGPQSAEAQRAMQLMLGTMQDAAQSAGNINDLLKTGFSVSPQDVQFAREANQASMDMARNQVQSNMPFMARMLQEAGLSKGQEGSTIDAINSALLGRESLLSLNNLASQQAGQTAQTLLNLPMQRMGMQLEGNNALLSSLLQGGQSMLGYDAAMRQLNQTTTSKTSQSPWAMAAQLGTQLGTAKLGG
jgi:hypothetical protein